MRTINMTRICKVALLVLAAFTPAAFASSEGGSGEAWTTWKANNQVANLGSLQRGARNFLNYCTGCHSLKYVRYSRLGEDLAIPEDLLEKYLVPANAKATDYITAAMPASDATTWFGTAPPDLSLIARARGTDYLYQFLKTFYVDPSKPTGVNNLRLDGTAMPHVLADLEGLKRAVFKTVESPNGGEPRRVFERFEEVSAGQLSPEEYDEFVRDIVNFLDYVGEPSQLDRRALGVWVVLFLLVFTWMAWLLKKEYWKDVH